MKRKGMVLCLLSAGMICTGGASAELVPGPGNTAFWIALNSPQQIDEQVAQLLAGHAAAITIRMPDQDVAPIRATVAKLKHASPHTPVLMYTWSNRNLKGRPGGAGITDWIAQDGDMQVHAMLGRGLDEFGDVTLPRYRSRLAANISAAIERRGFDGVALDLAIRTPRYKPPVLRRMCSTDAAFCDHYAEGMDATFAAIRASVGNRPILFNGLWNFGPGSVADQQLLLKSADAAAIEYFGGNFDEPVATHAFTQDVLPYLQAMAGVPLDKKIFVFARSPLHYYTSYAEDYAWQRYLHCAYLLGARSNTYFKYHASWKPNVYFDGRSGGLSIYADSLVDIGAPAKPYVVEGGLYSRIFAHGMVVVAPDDGRGGSFTLPHAMYSPEGDKLEGRVSLQPGQGLLLLDAKQANPTPDQRLLDLKLLADWPNASLSGSSTVPELSLQGNAADGSHDMLLDAIHSPHPFNTLQVSALAGSPTTRVELMAEVDDPARRNEFAILELKAPAATASGTPDVAFRTHADPKEGMPILQGPALTPGTKQVLSLDGHALFAKSGLTFRRWDFVRFDGAIKIQSVKLTN